MAQDTPAQDYQGTGQLTVGYGLLMGGRTFTGRLDELAIWRKALTASGTFAVPAAACVVAQSVSRSKRPSRMYKPRSRIVNWED